MIGAMTYRLALPHRTKPQHSSHALHSARSMLRLAALVLLCVAALGLCYAYRLQGASPTFTALSAHPKYIAEMQRKMNPVKTLAFDLLGTLIFPLHAYNIKPELYPARDGSIFSVSINNQPNKLFLYKRRGTDEFLKTMSQHYQLALYASTPKLSTEPMIEALDVDKVVTTRLYKEDLALPNRQRYASLKRKDLSLFNRDLRDVVLLDDGPDIRLMNQAQRDNCLKCHMITGVDDSDTHLIQMTEVLASISKSDDVRTEIRAYKKTIVYTPRPPPPIW